MPTVNAYISICFPCLFLFFRNRLQKPLAMMTCFPSLSEVLLQTQVLWFNEGINKLIIAQSWTFPTLYHGAYFWGYDAFTSLLCGTWCVRYMRERRGDRPGYYNFVTTVSAPPGEKMQLKHFCIFSLWLHLEKRELLCLLLFGLMFSPCILSCALPRKEHNQH